RRRGVADAPLRDPVGGFHAAHRQGFCDRPAQRTHIADFTRDAADNADRHHSGRGLSGPRQSNPCIETMRKVAPLRRILVASWFSGDSNQLFAASALGNEMIAMQHGTLPSPSSRVFCWLRAI